MAESDRDEELMLCDICGLPMALVRVTPKLGVLPELRTFQCTKCGDVRTKERGQEQ